MTILYIFAAAVLAICAAMLVVDWLVRRQRAEERRAMLIPPPSRVRIFVRGAGGNGNRPAQEVSITEQVIEIPPGVTQLTFRTISGGGGGSTFGSTYHEHGATDPNEAV